MKSCGPLGSITTNKASGGDGIPVELFQILKDDAVKVLHSIPLYTSVSFLLSCIQGRHCHLSKFHIYVLVYCIGVFLSGLLHSV